MAENLTLIRLTLEHRFLLLSMLEDYQTAGEQFLSKFLVEQLQIDFAALVQQFQAAEADQNLPAGQVPQSTLWLMRNRTELLGRVNLRHRLTPPLEHHGGHIGYSIRPSRRGQGYGTKMLALALEAARQLGLSKILMTCDINNLASARGIEKNGGILVSQGVSNLSGKLIARYWIAL